MNRLQRESYAEAHTQMMIDKYRADDFIRREKGRNIDLWFGKRKADGTREQDAPMPYCRQYYLCYFVANVFINQLGKDAVGLFPPLVGDVIPFLEKQFPQLDAIDTEYLEELLLQIQELGMFDSSTFLYVRGTGQWGRVNVSDVLAQGEGYATGKSIASPFSLGESYIGGVQQQERANLVRRWIANKGNGQPATNEKTPSLTYKQVALLTFFLEKKITKNNAADVAKGYELNSETGGVATLLRYWNAWNSDDKIKVTHPNRVASRLVADIEAILPSLKTEEQKIKAQKAIAYINNKCSSD
ncbi:hypothetical protein [Hymenobacter perfusus]|uniref:Uncharacterized protein n=1 Tax=Hymenobacter perfusus TaxID=1236770 RepID=A0A3R9N1U0_9BACT|nr:hypothetical protein [Hymenobacter perfusus]RSK46113.1 hypothetical protein EI293_02785 [Hymenobacter perfusus]